MTKHAKARDEIAAVVDVATAARLLGIGRGLAYRLIRSGEIPSLRLGRRLVVPRAQLDQLLVGADDSGDRGVTPADR